MYKNYFKRIFDFILSLLGLLVLSPLLIVLIIIGAIAMHGNPFFTQLRPGKDEKIFKLIKFRTMTNQKDKNGNLLPDNIRLTKYGEMLRSTSLDELPELINILKGDMAIVGPRPLLVRDMLFMSNEQRRRHTVRQGLTGLAQINGRNNITWDEKLKFDLEYIDKISFVTDFKIIFNTFFIVLKREDTIRDGTVTDVDLGDYYLEYNKISNEEYNQKLKQALEILDDYNTKESVKL